MKNLTAKKQAKEYLIELFGDDYSHIIGQDESRLAGIIKQYAKEACERQIGNCHADLRRQVQKEGLKISITVLNAVLDAEKPELK